MAGGPIGGNMALLRRGSPGVEIALTHYPAGGRQNRHAHDHAQVSFLLAGGVQETIGSRHHEMSVSAACIKPIGADHENLWSQSGALMLSVRLSNWDDETAPEFAVARWDRVKRPPPALIRAVIDAGSSDEVDAVVADLLGSLEPSLSKGRSPPGWLARVVEALWDGDHLSADAAAALAGVHRVHLARVFARELGVPFSVYRQYAMTSRAIEQTLRSPARLAAVAADSGFSDQAHMSRCVGAYTGLAPHRLRRSLNLPAHQPTRS